VFTNLLCVAVLVLADRVFKIAASYYLTEGSVVLIPGILGLRLLEGGNTGAAFGMFQGNIKALAVLSAVCSAVLLILLIINKFGSEMERWGMILLCGGAIGNLYDRLFEGAVTDYLEFLFMDFPIFNFADFIVDVGCLMIAIHVFFFADKEDRRKKVAEESVQDSDGEI